MIIMFRNVVIGMSGGVDSAVAAQLLKERGHNVLAVFMKNWDANDEFGHCPGEQDLLDADYACRKLNIELRQVNYVKDFWNSVFTHFLEDYQNGLTPNPDILCNKYIKFDLFHKYATETLKYDAIATGHYARISFGPYLDDYREDGDVRLRIPKDEFKDQTFFLAGIKRAALCRTMFPVGDYLKTEVKALALKYGLGRLANKRESNGICFIGNRDFKDFIKEYIHTKPGHFVDIDTGHIVGQHEGVHQWTLGQRCRIKSCMQPYFVAQKDVAANTIYVAAGHNHRSLLSDQILTTDVNWLCPSPMQDDETFRCRFRFQHTKPLVDCTLFGEIAGGIRVVLDRPLRAITPGQYAVFYNETDCLGSARIVSSTLWDAMKRLKNIL